MGRLTLSILTLRSTNFCSRVERDDATTNFAFALAVGDRGRSDVRAGGAEIRVSRFRVDCARGAVTRDVGRNAKADFLDRIFRRVRSAVDHGLLASFYSHQGASHHWVDRFERVFGGVSCVVVLAGVETFPAALAGKSF